MDIIDQKIEECFNTAEVLSLIDLMHDCGGTFRIDVDDIPEISKDRVHAILDNSNWALHNKDFYFKQNPNPENSLVELHC